MADKASKSKVTKAEKAMAAPSLSSEEIRNRNKRSHGAFLFKLTAFLVCLGAFTYYFWPWSQTFPPEFQHSHIRNLNSTDFESYVLNEDGQFRIIKFYANWCDHCKTMAPIWADVALENQDPTVEFLQVECSGNNKLCRKANVQGFPHWKIFYQGRIGYSRIGAVNETELRNFVSEGVKFTREGHARTTAIEKEAEKDAIHESGSAGKAHTEL